MSNENTRMSQKINVFIEGNKPTNGELCSRLKHFDKSHALFVLFGDFFFFFFFPICVQRSYKEKQFYKHVHSQQVWLAETDYAETGEYVRTCSEKFAIRGVSGPDVTCAGTTRRESMAPSAWTIKLVCFADSFYLNIVSHSRSWGPSRSRGRDGVSGVKR